MVAAIARAIRGPGIVIFGFSCGSKMILGICIRDTGTLLAHSVTRQYRGYFNFTL